MAVFKKLQRATHKNSLPDLRPNSLITKAPVSSRGLFVDNLCSVDRAHLRSKISVAPWRIKVKTKNGQNRVGKPAEDGRVGLLEAARPFQRFAGVLSTRTESIFRSTSLRERILPPIIQSKSRFFAMLARSWAGIGHNNPLHNPSRSKLARSRAKSCSSYSIQT